MSASHLNALRDRVRRIEAPARHGVLPFDVPEIDRALPGGGLALGAVHEILGIGGDEEDGAAAAGFIAGILARLSPSQQLSPTSPRPSPPPGAERENNAALPIPLRPSGGRGWPLRQRRPGEVGGPTGFGPVLWCLRRPDLYGPGLVAHGLDPGRLVLVVTKRDDEILWAIEEGLRTPGLAAVVGEVGRLPMVAGRRLQLAAERSGVTAFLLRRWRKAEEAAAERERPSAALTRWRVTSLSSCPHPSTASRRTPSPASGGGLGWGVGRPRWRVELLRCRGGAPAQWIVESGEVEMADATGHVSLSAALANRPAAPPWREANGIAPAEPFRRAG